jgi:hypothetical protein
MRVLLLLAGLLLSTPVFAQEGGLPGTYVLDAGGGTLVARIEMKGSTLTGTIDVNGKPSLRLAGVAKGNVSRGTIVSNDGAGTYEAIVEGDILKLTISQEAGPNQRAATVPFQFRRADGVSGGKPPVPTQAPSKGGAGDPRLVGNWTYQELLGGGGTSMAIEEKLVFRADGTYAYGKGRAVAGGADWSFDGGNGGDVERGRWRASDRVLFILDQAGQWARVGTYGMTDDGSSMRITYDGGGRKLWSRE